MLYRVDLYPPKWTLNCHLQMSMVDVIALSLVYHMESSVIRTKSSFAMECFALACFALISGRIMPSFIIFGKWIKLQYFYINIYTHKHEHKASKVFLWSQDLNTITCWHGSPTFLGLQHFGSWYISEFGSLVPRVQEFDFSRLLIKNMRKNV